MNVLSFNVLWQQNKAVFKKHFLDLTVFCGLAVVTWLIEVVYRQYFGQSPVISFLPILRGLPIHYLPELVAFFYIGRFACDLKAGPIPTSLSVSVTYVLTVILLLALFGTSGFWLLFSVLLMSPFLLGYIVQRILNQRSRKT